MFFFQRYGLELQTSYHYFKMQAENFPAHLHRAYEIAAVRSGHLHAEVDDQEYHLREGEALFVFNRQIHSYETDQGTVLDILIFSPELIADFHTLYEHKIPNQNLITGFGSSEKLESASIYKMKALLYLACDDLVKRSSFIEPRISSQSNLLWLMLSHITEHYQEECTLKDLAEQLSYDYKYLSRLFIKGTGTGFNEYVNRYRIARADEMIRTTAKSVREIAEACGYDSIRTFHRNYKKMHGMTPGEVRGMIPMNGSHGTCQPKTHPC